MCIPIDSLRFLCDLCGSSKFRVRKSLNRRLEIEGSKFNVVRCLNCGLLSICPLPDESEFDSIYQDYGVKRDRLSHETKRLNIYGKKLRKLEELAVGKRLLDIGAGLGTFVKCAKEYGYDATGIEYEKGQCRLAKELYGIDLINSKFEDAYELLRKRSFDVINLHHVLEHVQSPKKLLKRIYNILSSKGILLIEVPNQFFNLKTELRYYLFRKWPHPDNALHHLYFFSIKTLKKYIELTGFKIVEVNQFPRSAKTGLLSERLSMGLYLYLTSKLDITASSFIEVFLRK